MLCVLKRLVESEHWTGKRKAYLPRDVHGNLSSGLSSLFDGEAP